MLLPFAVVLAAYDRSRLALAPFHAVGRAEHVYAVEDRQVVVEDVVRMVGQRFAACGGKQLPALLLRDERRAVTRSERKLESKSIPGGGEAMNAAIRYRVSVRPQGGQEKE